MQRDVHGNSLLLRAEFEFESNRALPIRVRAYW